MNISGKAGFRLDSRFGKSGSQALASKLTEDQRSRVNLCKGILSAVETGRAFAVHQSTIRDIWRKNENHIATPETTDSLGTD